MLSKWCENTSCDGIKELYEVRKKKGHFCFWACTMTIMCVGTVYFTYNTILGYVDTPSVTNVRMIRENPLEMPKVLICFNGGFNAQKMRDANFTDSFIISFHGSFIFQNPPKEEAAAVTSELNAYLSKWNMSLPSFLTQFSFTCDEILTRYETKPFLTGNCEQAAPMNTERGICYGFNNTGKQVSPGLLHGLYLYLQQPRGSFAELYPHKGYELQKNKDFLITLEKVLSPRSSKRSLLVPMNMKVEVTLNTKVFTRLGGNNPCDDDMNAQNANTCYFKCFDQEFREKFQCTHITRAYGRNKTAFCDLFVDLNIINNENVVNCSRLCLPKCTEWIFDSTSMQGPLDTLVTNGAKTIVNIGYTTMHYTKIEEVNGFTFDMAVANVGGQLGLWLGISIVSIVQALYYLAISVYQQLKQRQMSKNSKN